MFAPRRSFGLLALGSLISLSVVLLVAGDVFARDCVDYARNPQWRGRIDLPAGTGAGIAVAGSTAYVVSPVDQIHSRYRLYTFDIADPSAPVYLGLVEMTGVPVRVALSGTMAIVAETSGLRLVDVSDAHTPQPRGFLPLSTPPWDIDASGALAYVATGNEGLSVADIHDPDAPAIVGGASDHAAFVARVVGSRLLASSGALVIYDLADPAHPEFVSEVSPGPCGDQGCGFGGVDGRGDIAYAVRNDSWCDDPAECRCTYFRAELCVFDLADPYVPAQISRIPLGATASGGSVLARGERLYVWGDRGSPYYVHDAPLGIQIFDVSQPTPRLLHRLRDGPRLAGIGGESGETVLCALGWQELNVYDLTHATRPHAIDGERNSNHFFLVNDVALHGEVAYAVTHSYVPPCGPGDGQACDAIRAYDASGPPGLPELVNWTSCDSGYGFFGNVAADLEVAGDNLYVTAGTAGGAGGLFQSRISKVDGAPETPTPVTLPAGATDAEPVGRFLLVAMQSAGLAVLDTNGGDPILVAEAPDHDVRSLDVSGSLAASVGWNAATGKVEFRTIDASDPTSPQFLGVAQWPQAAATWVAMDGRVAAVGDAQGTVQMIDVSDPLHPVAATARQLRGFATDGRTNPRVSGGDLANSVLYATLGNGGLAVLWVRDPYHPQFVGTVATDRSVNVLASDRGVFVCDAGGLNVIPQDCRAFLQERVLPESNAGAIPGATRGPGFSLRVEPTPFATSTRLVFEKMHDGAARLDLFDVTGRRIRGFTTDGAPGPGSVTWDGRATDGSVAPAGVYFVRLVSREGTITRKLVRTH